MIQKVILGMIGLAMVLNLPASEIPTITLKQAIQIGLKNNPQFQQGKNQVKMNGELVKQKRHNFYPDLTLTARENFVYGESDSTSTSVNLTSTLTLFNGGYNLNSLKEATSNLKASGHSLKRQVETLVFNVIQQYITILNNQEIIRVEEENLKAQQQQLARIEAFHKAGRRPIADLYQQKSEISTVEFRLLNSRKNFETSKLQLLQILGLPAHSPFQVTDTGIEMMLQKIKELDGESLGLEASDKRPDLKAAKFNIQAGTHALSASKSGYWPRLELFADLSTAYNSTQDWVSFSDQFFDQNPNLSLGVSIQYSILNRRQTTTQVALAQYQLENDKLEYRNLNNQVQTEVAQALKNYQAAQKQIQVAKDRLKFATIALESMTDRYNVNAATLTELTTTRAQHLQANQSSIEAKYNLLLQGINTLYVSGGLEKKGVNHE